MQSKKRALFSGIIAVLLGLMTGCESPKTEKFGVFVSILPQKFVVERIGGDKVDVSVMAGPGQSPATYEPLPQQMIDLSQAAVYFRIGVPFEQAWMKKIQSINPGMKIIDTREGIPLREMDSFHETVKIPEGEGVNDREHSQELEHGQEFDHVKEHESEPGETAHHHHYEGKDPHIWLNPELVEILAQTICETLSDLDGKNKEYYESNLYTFTEELDSLSAGLERAFASVQAKKILVFHPSWGYFADRFGLVQIPIEIEGKEPGPGQLSKIIEFALKENIRVIFVQSQFSTKSAETIAREINGTVVAIDPLAEDYMENLRNAARTIIRNIK